MIKIINNACEYSRSIQRSDGNKLDICAFKKEKELVLAIVNEEDIHVQEIVLSQEELAVLLLHLNDPIVQEILSEDQDIVSVRCPNCKRMVTGFHNHPCKG